MFLINVRVYLWDFAIQNMSNVFVSGLWTVCCLDAEHVLLCCYCEPHSAGHFSCFMTSLQLRQSQAVPLLSNDFMCNICWLLWWNENMNLILNPILHTHTGVFEEKNPVSTVNRDQHAAAMWPTEDRPTRQASWCWSAALCSSMEPLRVMTAVNHNFS